MVLYTESLMVEKLQTACLCASMIIAGWVCAKRLLYHGQCPRFGGPRGIPWFGNLFQLKEQPWLQYTEWHKQHGPIYSLDFAGQAVLVIGNAKIAADLLDRRSSIYSDRPRFIMAAEILTNGMNLAFARYGDRWKRMRRAANFGLSAKVVVDYAPILEREAINLARGLLHLQAGTIDLELRRTAAATVLGVVYAHPDVKVDDPVVQKVDAYVTRMLKAALPGNYLVDIFPLMIYLPSWLAKWKRDGYAWFEKDTNMFIALLNEAKSGLDNGTRPECFVAKLTAPGSGFGLDATETAWLAGMMFGAGGEALPPSVSLF